MWYYILMIAIVATIVILLYSNQTREDFLDQQYVFSPNDQSNVNPIPDESWTEFESSIKD
jgi:hypothetical protein